MALEAERAHVAQIAFTAACDDGDDVVGIPQGFAAFQTPRCDGFEARGSTKTADVGIFGNTIRAAFRTDALIAFEDALPQMARIAAETPFFDAESGAEGLTAGRDFELAPTAEATAVWAFR